MSAHLRERTKKMEFRNFHLERRAPVWQALSELFVGKELQDYDYAAIAETLRGSKYSLDELEKVLHEEVAPPPAPHALLSTNVHVQPIRKCLTCGQGQPVEPASGQTTAKLS